METRQRRYCTDADYELQLKNLLVVCDGEISDIKAEEIIIEPYIKHTNKISGWSPLEEMVLKDGRFDLQGVQISLFDTETGKEVLFTKVEVPTFVWNDKDIEEEYLEKLSERIIEAAKKKVVEVQKVEEPVIEKEEVEEIIEEVKEPTEFEKEIEEFRKNGYTTKDFNLDKNNFTAVIKDKSRSYILLDKDNEVFQTRIKETSSNDNSNTYDFQGTKIIFDKVEKNIVIIEDKSHE